MRSYCYDINAENLFLLALKVSSYILVSLKTSPLVWRANQWTNGLIYDRDLRQERVNEVFNLPYLNKNLSLTILRGSSRIFREATLSSTSK